MTATVDLSETLGLLVLLELGTGTLLFGRGVESATPATRRLDDLRSVLRDPSSVGPEIVSHLYRSVQGTDGGNRPSRPDVRFDLTVTLPGTLSREYLKTTGHYHARGPDGVSFPELYEVCHGRAAFVLQRVDDAEGDRPRVERVWVQICDPGDRILIPCGIGHVTVNIGSVPLVVSDLVSSRCGQLYESFRALRGAAYHVLCDQNLEHGLRLERNGAYGELPVPTVATGSRFEPFLERHGPLHGHLRSRPADFDFLDRPAPFCAALAELWPA